MDFLCPSGGESVVVGSRSRIHENRSSGPPTDKTVSHVVRFCSLLHEASYEIHTCTRRA